MGPIPINRIVAFLGPLIAVLAGAVADWVLKRLHFLSDFHTHTEVANYVTQIAIFGVTAVLVWLGQQTWLKGWIQHESVVTAISEANAVDHQTGSTTETHHYPSGGSTTA